MSDRVPTLARKDATRCSPGMLLRCWGKLTTHASGKLVSKFPDILFQTITGSNTSLSRKLTIRYGIQGPSIPLDGDPNSQRGGVTAVIHRQLLEEELPTLLDGDNIFMHDNAPIHTARIVRDYLENELAFPILDWPPYSPDLNPIENLWKTLKQRIHKKKIQG